MGDLDPRRWQAHFREYLAVVRGLSARTVETYAAELRPLLAYLERQGLTSLARLTRAHLEGYRLELSCQRHRDRPLTLSTMSLRLTAVKQFLRYLYRESYLLLDLAADLELPASRPRLPRTILSEREVIQLLEAPDLTTPEGIRDRTLLELLYGTALRNTELRHLRVDQVDREQGQLRLDHGKGGKPRILPLGEEALAWLEEYLDRVRPLWVKSADQPLVFPGFGREDLTRRWLAHQVRRLARQAGLEKTVTPHVLRHSCATHMLRRGANLRHLQQLLGHSDMNTTSLYTRVEVSDLAKVIERYHPRERDDDLR